jgi:hypothetical protein
MEHQYPNQISGDEGMLAELMLPDQTHVRSQDWTIFFLHKDTDPDEGGEVLGADKEASKRRKETDEGTIAGGEDHESLINEARSSEEGTSGEGPPLMYVLNLVNTKQDNTVRR